MMENNKISDNIAVGIYGWRKRCLYCLLLLLIVLILVNLSLTVWILVVLRFNIDGMGSVRVTENGLQAQGVSEFLNTLYTNGISTDKNDQLQIRSHQDITMRTQGSVLEVSSSHIKMSSQEFSIYSNARPNVNALFSVQSNGEVSVGSSSLYFEGSQGVSVLKDLETGQVADLNNNGIQLESFRGDISLAADDTLLLNSRDSSIDLLTGENLTLSSYNGMISISAGSVLFESLPLSTQMGNPLSDDVYHLCICPSGKLYRSLANHTNLQGCLTSENFCETI